MIPLRTVTYALDKLLKQNLLCKVPHLMDMRKQLYHLDKDKILAIQNDINHLRAMAGIHMRVF